jgi:hypothetical protein
MKDLVPRLQKTGEIRVSFPCNNINDKLDIRQTILIRKEKPSELVWQTAAFLGPTEPSTLQKEANIGCGTLQKE